MKFSQSTVNNYLIISIFAFALKFLYDRLSVLCVTSIRCLIRFPCRSSVFWKLIRYNQKGGGDIRLNRLAVDN